MIPGSQWSRRIMSMKNFNENIDNWSRDLPACSAMPQPITILNLLILFFHTIIIIRIFAINFIILCTFFLLFLPLSSNSALFVYCVLPLSTIHLITCTTTELNPMVITIEIFRKEWFLSTNFPLIIIIISRLFYGCYL